MFCNNKLQNILKFRFSTSAEAGELEPVTKGVFLYIKSQQG